MPWRMMLALLFMTAAIGPASAQTGQSGGATSQSQGSSTDGSQSDLIWNLVGLLGLVGLIGLLPQHEDDSYHPAEMD